MTSPTLSEEQSRRYRRALCSEFVKVRFLDVAGRAVEQVGLLEDIGPGGLCVSLDLPLAPGRRVEVDAEGFHCEAEVRYCELGDYSYIVGCEFCSGSKWERKHWQPKHFFQAPD